jgi:hypothetical protein
VGGAGVAGAGAVAAGAAGPPRAPRPRTAAAGAPRPAVAPLRTSSPSATVPPRGRTGGGRGGRFPALPIALALAAVLVVGIGLAVVLGGDDEPNTASTPTPTVQPPAGAAEAERTTETSPAARADTTVAVLNGTTTPGLARRVAEDIEAGGFRLGTVDNATEQNRSATLIQYVDGAREQARTVASLIDIGSDAISPIDQSTRTVAGESARVVVTVGADQNQAQQE